jgi:molybdopterin converting factor small subunit
MEPFAKFAVTQSAGWSISGLDPAPEEEWQTILAFLNLSADERKAMLATVEVLFRRGHELVVGTYDYLLSRPETAAILGWERTADEKHLAERRRFFTIWLARLLGLDMSGDLAKYLFRAGKLHAGHGPRHTHVPPVYVTASISLVNATFARFLSEEMPGDPDVPLALAGWNKLLAAHLHLMQMGYKSAVALDSGDFPVRVAFFARLRDIMGLHNITMHLAAPANMHHALCRLFNYFPAARAEVFNLEWQSGERVDHTGTPWFTTQKQFTIKPAWRVLLNGKDINYLDGAATAVQPGDEIHIFPPGR